MNIESCGVMCRHPCALGPRSRAPDPLLREISLNNNEDTEIVILLLTLLRTMCAEQSNRAVSLGSFKGIPRDAPRTGAAAPRAGLALRAETAGRIWMKGEHTVGYLK